MLPIFKNRLVVIAVIIVLVVIILSIVGIITYYRYGKKVINANILTNEAQPTLDNPTNGTPITVKMDDVTVKPAVKL